MLSYRLGILLNAYFGQIMKIGIDPGINGAIAFVSDEEIILCDMPTIEQSWSRPNKKTGKIQRMVDTKTLYEMLFKECGEQKEDIESITIEVVHSMPKQGVSSTWAFSGAFYSALTVANMFDCQINMVLPTKWKKKFGLINMPKDAARLAVLKMYPGLIPQLKRKKDVDRADALLIAVS